MTLNLKEKIVVESVDQHRLEWIHIHNFYQNLIATLDQETIIIIPDFMSKTRLGQGPRYTSNLPNAPDIPVFGVTFIYLDANGDLKRSYAVIPCTHPSSVGFVVIKYLDKIFNTARFSGILRTKRKVFVTKMKL